LKIKKEKKMKSKKLNKRLALNKKTIAHLEEDVLNGAKGGVTNDTCESCNDYTYCWGCPTLICPDIRPSAGCVTENTLYETCVDQTCVCSENNYSCPTSPCG
jgi:hypothetical protein